MGFRFRKVIKIAPGIKLNVSKKGLSTSIGRKGATVNIGRNGVRGTVGIPGSGLSYSQQLTNKRKRATSTTKRTSNGQAPAPLPIPSDILLDSNNKAIFVDNQNQVFEPRLQTKLRKEYSGVVEDFLTGKVEEINEITMKIENIKQYFEPPRFFYEDYIMKPFPESGPNYNEIYNRVKEEKGFFWFLQQKQLKETAEQEFQQKMDGYNQNKQDWDQQQSEIKQLSDNIQKLRMKATMGDIQSMDELLENLLLYLDAPIRFSGSFDVESADNIWLDIDLPEIEDIPTDIASVNASNGISVKKKTKKKIKEDYADLVSGIVLILASNVFALLPTVESIVVSGYTQRLDKSTGHVKDDYIYSVIVEKSLFEKINLEYVSPFAALSNFRVEYNVSKGMEWKTISPFSKGQI